MPRVRTLLTFCVLIGFGGAAAHATPIAFTESVSGDLGQGLPAPTVFAFDLGVNTIGGTFGISVFDVDSFAFSVPMGTQVTSVGFAYVITTLPANPSAFASFYLDNDNAFLVSPELAYFGPDLLAPSPLGAFGGALPLGPGTYGMNAGGLGSGFGFGWTADYTWSFTVAPAGAPVPEPASLTLLGLGLAALVARLRR